MNLLMCLTCGEFVNAVVEDGTLVPMKEACPHCGGTRFRDNESGRDLDTAG